MTDRDELREHSFDGIQEYDNDLPRWWVWLFIITVVFAVIYPFIYGPEQFATGTIDAELAAGKKTQLAMAAAAGAVDEAALLKVAKDSKSVSEGSQIYASKCLACHGDKAQGVIGPNLTDQYWIHGGKITDIHNIVTNGFLEKGMLAWKDQLSPEQLNAVVAFVWSIYGSNPPNSKAAQGDKVDRN